MTRVVVALAGTDRGRSGLGTYARAVLPRLRDALAHNGGSLVALGTPADFEAYRDALHGVECTALPASADAPAASAGVHLFAADWFAHRARADVLLMLAANRRTVLGTRVPSVAVVHDLAQFHVPAKFDALRMFYVRTVLTRALRRATRVVAISACTREDLVHGVGIDPSTVSVVPNGVDTARFPVLETDSAPVLHARSTLGLDRPYVLYPSRLEHPGKNHVRLVNAFARTELTRTHDLVLAGPDWGARSHIERAAVQAGVHNRVRIVGRVPDDTLSGLMSGADAVAVMGLWEGFGLPALEALSAGRPVLASNTGALPEAVGPHGALCDPHSTEDIARGLMRVVRDATLRARASLNGPAWAREHTWERTTRGLLSACDEAVRSRGVNSSQSVSLVAKELAS